MSVYKPCDIRGPVAELSDALYRSWGHSIGQRLAPGGHVYVGGDVRRSTPRFLTALVEGLCAHDLSVHNLGAVPTPMVYFAGRQGRAAACAIVTASHSPPDINGLKWTIGEIPPTEAMVAEFEREAQVPATGSGPRRGSVVSEDISAAYRQWLHEQLAGPERRAGPPCRRNTTSRDDSPSPGPETIRLRRRLATADKLRARPLPRRGEAGSTVGDVRLSESHVVLDPGNGCWASRCGDYARELLPQCRFTIIHDRPDGTFPDRNPDSARPEFLQELCAQVVDDAAGLGIAFDGDGDRLSFVDHEGRVLTAEQATWTLLQLLGEAVAGQSVVYDVKFSDLVPDTVRRLGGEPVRERSGHAFIRTRMMATGAVFGAEVSGHYFYRELHGGDDAFYSGMRFLRMLAAGGRRLADWRKACPAVFLTSDLRVPVDPRDTPRVLAQAEEVFAGQPIDRTDGLRISFPDGWGLMRASVTEPAITFRFEGRNAAALERIVRDFCLPLGPLGEELQRRYRQSR